MKAIMLTARQLLAVGQSVAIFRAVHDGLGRHEDDLRASQFGDMEKVDSAVLGTFEIVSSLLTCDAVGLVRRRRPLRIHTRCK